MAMNKYVKWFLFAIGAIVGLIILIGISIYLYQYFSYERPKNKVTVSVVANKKFCETKKHPLWVTIFNDSNRTILKTHFRIAIRNKGYSDDISGYNTYSEDRIIKPDTGYGACWTIPEPGSWDNYKLQRYKNAKLEDLVFSIDYYRIEFEE